MTRAQAPLYIPPPPTLKLSRPLWSNTQRRMFASRSSRAALPLSTLGANSSCTRNSLSENSCFLGTQVYQELWSTDRKFWVCEISNSKGKDDRHGEERGEDDNMNVYRRGGKQKRYSGDLLPFDVITTTPPPTQIGRFQLDPRTHCGDIIEHNGRHYIVKRVRLHYRYGLNGKPDVFKKTIEIKSLARKALETYLEKTLMGS